MRKIMPLIVSSLIFWNGTESIAQTCSGVLSNGQNLVTNGDFSQGYSGWTHDPEYIEFTPCGSSCYSVPGRIYAGSDEQSFNQAFPNRPDHTSSSDDMYLMVDGICTTGIKLWSQANIPIEPNTNYFFTVYVASLKDSPNYPGTLQFDINGTNLTSYPIQAPGNTTTWVKVTATWFSGPTPPATATISIENTTTTGCNTEVDFAIDDISFSPGCEFGGPGPLPDLGPDFSICGLAVPFTIDPGFDAATAARNDITYTWYKDGVEQTSSSGVGPSFYSFSVNAPGTYAVCVDSAGNCKKTDQLVINNSYSIDLGPDLTLCNPTTATLDAGYTSAGVTYQWYKGGALINGQSGSTLTITSPGTYSVTVTDPSCGVQSDNVTVTTNAATPNDGTFCPITGGGTGIANLSVTDPVGYSGKYKWYDAPSGGNVVATGPSYTTPVLPGPGPYTYYVEDTSTFKLTVGPSATGSYSNPTNISTGDSKNLLVFNALTSFKLDSITVLPYNYYCPTPATGNANTVNFIIYDANNNIVGTSSYTAQCNGQGQPAPPLKVPVGIDIPEGNGYQIRLNTGSTQIALYLNPGTFTYPTTFGSAVQFVSNSPGDFNQYYSPNALPGYFDWVITKGINCERVPVSAIQDCPACITSTPPSSASADVTSFCEGSVSQITLSVAPDGSGDELVWYTGLCGGTEIARNPNDNDIIVTAPTSVTTYFARWESNDGCNSSCVSVTVTPVADPTASTAGMDQSICNSTVTPLAANSPSVGTGQWSIVSGVGNITNPSSPTSTVTGIDPGDLVLEWTISNSPCSPSSTQVTIHRDTLSTPVITGASFDTCALTTGIIYSTLHDNSPTTSYSWSGTGTLSIASQSGNSATVDIGASGGTLQVTETNGVCSLPATADITIAPSVTAADAGTTQTICISSTTLNATSPAVGTGKWSVSSGSGTLTDPFNNQTTVTALGNGANVFTWTVNGCGGPLSDVVTINVGTSGMTMDATGPSDTMCVDYPRDLNVLVTGGTGSFTFYWVSSDSSFKATTSNPIVTVKPSIDSVTYYVYAVDLLNIGCQSNVDSVTVHAVSSQNLWFNNLVTPNEDGLNDKFTVRDVTTLQKALPGTTLEVYNTWGSSVYKSDNYDNTWGGEELADGVYYFNLKAGCGEKVYRGWFHVLSNTHK